MNRTAIHFIEFLNEHQKIYDNKTNELDFLWIFLQTKCTFKRIKLMVFSIFSSQILFTKIMSLNSESCDWRNHRMLLYNTADVKLDRKSLLRDVLDWYRINTSLSLDSFKRFFHRFQIKNSAVSAGEQIQGFLGPFFFGFLYGRNRRSFIRLPVLSHLLYFLRRIRYSDDKKFFKLSIDRNDLQRFYLN